MRLAALLRLAVAGTRTDTTRMVLTTAGSLLGTVALLSAATVLAIRSTPERDAPYTNALLAESGLRPGLATALIMLTVPVLLFVGQCARLGAPARDRRLAAIRLAGATPGQSRAIAAVESGVATLLGALLGLAVFLVGRRLLDAPPDAQGLRPLPTDVLPDRAAIAVIVLGLPLVATLATAVLLRKVIISPLGVVRRTRPRAPRPWPGALVVLGIALYAGLSPALRALNKHGTVVPAGAILGVLFFGALAAAIGIVGGAAWISFTIGRVLGRWARRPAALIAGRRLQSDPWSGSRSLAALLAAALLGGGAAWVTSSFRQQQALDAEQERLLAVAIGEPFPATDEDFYLRAMQLVGYAVLVAAAVAAAGLAVAVATSIVERRRSLASLTASGVPRGVLGRAIVWQSMAVAVPAVLLALVTGLAMGRGYAGSQVHSGASSVSYCTPPPDQPDVCNTRDQSVRAKYERVAQVPARSADIRVPWADLGVIGAWSVGVSLLTALLGVAFLRASTAPEELRTT